MNVEEPPKSAMGQDGPSFKQIYDELIARCHAHVWSVTSSVFDPETGIIKTFVQGKLMSVKQVRSDK